MRNWARALALLLGAFVGLILFYRVAGAGSIGEGALSAFQTTSGSSSSVAQGAQGVLVNGLSGIPQGPPFTIGLDTEISTNTVRSRAGTALTLIGTLGGLVTVQSNLDVLTALSAVSAAITTISTDKIQQRTGVTPQFSSDAGWLWLTSAGSNGAVTNIGPGLFTVDVATASGGFVLATGDWYGADLAFITTENTSNSRATNSMTAPVGMFTTLNVTNGTATGTFQAANVGAGLGNITTLNVTDVTATRTVQGKNISGTLGNITTLNVTDGAATGSWSAPTGFFTTMKTTRTECLGPNGAVSATFVIGQTGNVTTMFVDTENVTTVQAPQSNNVSLTVAGSTGAPVVHIKAGHYLHHGGVTADPVAGQLDKGDVWLRSDKGFAPYWRTTQGKAAPQRVYIVETGNFTQGGTTTLTQIGTGITLKNGALTTGGFVRLEACGRIAVRGGDTVQIGIFSGVSGGTGGTQIAGVSSGLGLDSRATPTGDDSGALIDIDWYFVLREPPDAATLGQPGGMAGIQNNSADAAGTFQCLSAPFRAVGGDLTGATASPDLTADKLVALEIKWSNAAAFNTITLTNMRWTLCQP